MTQKDATPFTEAANKALLNELNWEDTRDFESAARGFIASLDEPIITGDNGRPAWDLGGYPFLEEETAPPSANPSLWRISRLNALYHGLFKVTDGIHQIRGFDLSVMSIIETDTGYIVVTPGHRTDCQSWHGTGLSPPGPEADRGRHLYPQPH